MLDPVTAAYLTGTAAMPFAVVSDAVVAGIFSIVNTALSALIVHRVNRAANLAAANHEKVSKVETIVDRRLEDQPPPDGRRKRECDR